MTGYCDGCGNQICICGVGKEINFEQLNKERDQLKADRDKLKNQIADMYFDLETAWVAQEVLSKMTAERDRLAEINKVLVEALQTTLDRYEDMNGGFFDSESKRIREVLARTKETGK